MPPLARSATAPAGTNSRPANAILDPERYVSTLDSSTLRSSELLAVLTDVASQDLILDVVELMRHAGSIPDAAPIPLRECLHDAVRRHFARRPVLLQLTAADPPAVGARGFVGKQRHGLQL
jgi:hypothetical protein